MTKYLSAIVLVATVVVAACSGGGSGAGAPAPITVPSTWAISSFTASDTEPFVGSVVAITASATKDGAAAPDGTTITISVAYAGSEPNPEFGLGSIGTTTHRLASSGGTVTTSLIANTVGPYNLVAKVSTASAGLTVTYKHRDPSGTLQIFQPLLPNMGSLNGGEQVTLNGKAIVVPVEVDFEVNGETYPGIVVGGTPSDPPSGLGQIIVRTPYISNLTDDERLQDWSSSVTVRVGLGTADEQTETLPGAFTFLAGPSGPQSALQEPFIYLVIPDHGQSAGGQQVTILGRNFRATVTDADGNVTDMPVAVDTVTFGGIDSVVLSVSADGTQIVAQTPRWSIIPLDADTAVDVVVTTSYESDGPYTATLANGFVYIADEPTPEITALAPTGGPIDGGEQVTIFGHGFQVMAQVTFGNLEAIGVQVNDDQTLADQDTIICVTPDYSQQGDEPPVAVDVVVRNVLTGKVSPAATYTYGDNLYISGNTPAEGGAGDNIIIYGSGFEAPLQVDHGTTRLDVLSVSGTELLVRFPVDTPPSCVNVTASFTVTLLESGAVTDGGTFTFLGSNPQIFGVDPIFVSENGGGTLTITGEYFSPDLIVSINNYRLLSGHVTVTGTTHIEVDVVPDIDLIGLVWDTSACVDGNGIPGVRIVPTPVDITVTNLPGECSDTLAGGLVYEPLNQDCFVGFQVDPLVIVFVDVDLPDSTTNTDVPGGTAVVTVTNPGAVTVNMSALTTNPAFSIDNTYASIAPAAFETINVTFNTAGIVITPPDIHTLVEGFLNISTSGAGIPVTQTQVALSGTALAEPELTIPEGDLDFDVGPDTEMDLTVTNNGNAVLTWSLTETDPDNVFSPSVTSGIVDPGFTETVTVTFTPGGGGAHTGSLEVEATNTNATVPSVTINLNATDPP